MANIIASLSTLVVHIISSLGYGGVFFLMALQTMAVPIPSEIVLPFAGFLVFTGRFNLWILAFVGGLGSMVGASIAYYIGHKGGRSLIRKYGRFIFLSESELELTGNFFKKHGIWSVLIGQHLPIIRSFLGFPAGLARMPLKKFLPTVFLGSFVWSLVLSFIGFKLGENWGSLKDKFHNFDNLIIALIVLGAGFWVWKHFRGRK